MATSAPAACAPEVLQQIRRTLADHPMPELGKLLPTELNSLADLICALSEPDGAFRAQFERLSNREELVALAAGRGIPVEPSLLERFERLARGGQAEPLSDAQLETVAAGKGTDLAVRGLQSLLPGLLRFAPL
ncbi:MAG: hypothetical protein VKL97_03040 [Cyanobacteriota bacterium]|nr:hypothetical protein [Cyanobacteriota bacterium]